MIHFLVAIFLFHMNASANEVKDSYIKKKEEFIKKEELNRDILSDIYAMQKRLKKLNSDKNKMFAQKIKVEDQILRLEPIVESANKKLLKQKIEIQKRLQFIFKFQDMSFAKVIFSSQAPSELDRNLRILKNITERDYNSLQSYFRNTKILNAKKEELQSKKDDLHKLQYEINYKESLLLSESKKKTESLKKIEKQKQKLINSLQALRARNKADDGKSEKENGKKEEFLQTILEPLFFERKGNLVSPVHGNVVQSYGDFEHPTYQTKFRHKGVFFKSKNDDVLAVAPGRVAHIEKIPGQGYTLIIDHNDHYFSVYSHLSQVTVLKDAVLKEGDEIGETGALHPFFGAGLYYELRHFSEPINPDGWIKL